MVDEFGERCKRWGLKMPAVGRNINNGIRPTWDTEKLRGIGWYMPSCFHDAVMSYWEENGRGELSYYDTLNKAMTKEVQAKVAIKAMRMDLDAISEDFAYFDGAAVFLVGYYASVLAGCGDPDEFGIMYIKPPD